MCRSALRDFLRLRYMEFISRLCDPVIVMAEGSVLFEGSAEEAKKDEKVIESYLGRGSKLKDEN